MKRFLHLSPKDRIWLEALVLLLGLFGFLLWLGAAEDFWRIFILMIATALIIIGSGLALAMKKDRELERALIAFLEKPTPKREKQLWPLLGKGFEEPIHSLGKGVRGLQIQRNLAQEEGADYQEFIEGWVHEVKTPLSLMTFVLENRKDEMSPLVYRRLHHARQEINIKTEQILYYAKLHQSHRDYRFEKVTLTEIVGETLEGFEALISEKGILIHLMPKEDSPTGQEDITLITDPKTFSFVLSQVFSNSLKYMKSQSGKGLWITQGFYKESKTFYLTIKDEGEGVKASDLPFIFDKGFTANYATKGQSTGMGLYLVQKLCEEMNIKVEADSTYGEFFEITFLIPAVEEN